MKKSCSILIGAAALASVAGCGFHVANWSNAELKATTNLVQNATIPAGLKTLDVNNAFGVIHITGSDNGPFGWSQKLTVRAHTDADLREFASNLLCHADLAGDRLQINVTAPDSREPHGFRSDLEITVPKSAAVRTHDQFGRTEIVGVNGDVEAGDQFGAMELRDLGGKVRAGTSYGVLKINHTGPAILKSQFGAIEAADIRGPLDAETSYATLDARDIGGAVRLRNQFGGVQVEHAGDADLKTSYAELRVKNITGDARLVNQFGRVSAEAITGSVRAETSYGSLDITGPGADFDCDNQFGGITVRATSAALTHLAARTSYATLEVRLPAGLKPALSAHTAYGDIDSDFPVLMKPRGQDAFAGLPPGTPRITLQNENGKIRVIGK